MGFLSLFLNIADATKSYKASHMSSLYIDTRDT